MNKEKIVKLKENISKFFVGKDKVTDMLLTALLANGHILLEDVPGVGKTTLAKALAYSIDAPFARIQFTPDTLPTDITGMNIFDAAKGEFRLIKGPIHNSIILADEINRTSPKTQSALLEAMEERQVTIDKTVYPLPKPFMVIATQNPVEQLGTYQLPEAELDRFFMKLSIGYPGSKLQMEMAKKYLAGEFEMEIKPVINSDDIMKMQEEVKQVTIKDDVIEYALSVVDKTRSLESLEYGLSPRAGLVLLSASKAAAYLEGRDFVIPEDVVKMAKAVLPHRLILTTQARMNKYTGYQIISETIDKIKRPM